MVITLPIVLHIVAIILLVLAAINFPRRQANAPAARVNLGWLGLAFWALSEIIGRF